MKHSLVPGGSSGEITCRSRGVATTLADVLLDEDYVVMISREEDLYIVDYIWSQRGADRNDVVFMDRDEFDTGFCEVEDEEEDDFDYCKQQRIKCEAENSAWHVVAKLLSKSPEQIEEIFGVTTDEERTRFWTYYPDQILYDEARERLYQWERKQMADTEDAVMDAAMNAWDKMNEDQYAGKAEEYCDDI